MIAPIRTILTCEHGGYDVPENLRHLFRGASVVLRSHEGWDPGALEVAVACAAALHAPLICTQVSRLVIECNRSLHHPRLFSRFTRSLGASQRDELIDRHWRPYRAAVESLISGRPGKVPVRHISVHSFTPVLDGVIRELELGILFDPARPSEALLARRLRDRLSELEPTWRIRMNRPYRGTADGFTTFLRTRYADDRYCGIEIEINQQMLARRSSRQHIGDLLARAIHLA